SLPDGIPDVTRFTLHGCLEKERKRRFRNIADVRIALEFERAVPGALPSPTNLRRRIVSVFAVLSVLTAATFGLLYFRRIPERPPEVRLEVNTPPTSDLISFALSHDGRQLAFIASLEGRPQIWIRSLDSTTAWPVKGTEGASSPFWSPDNHSLGFFADGKLK